MSKQIETKLQELDELVKYFEIDTDQLDLKEGIEKYKKATKLVKSIKKELEEVELTINEIKLGNNDK